MFLTDLISSSRGPWVISSLFMLAFSGEMQGGNQPIESVIRSQTMEIDNYQNKILSGEKILSTSSSLFLAKKDLSRIKIEKPFLAAKISSLNQRIEAEKAELAATNLAFESYKDKYRAYIRGKGVGQTMAQLETQNGVIYKNVTIREVTALEIQIRHEDGIKRIPFEELPLTMIDYYQFDAEQKAAATVVQTMNSNVLVDPVKTPGVQDLQIAPISKWLPKSNSEVADCSLFVKVSKGLSPDGSITAWNGTAFLCYHGASTYIYSNAHNFDGAIEFSIEDKFGKKYDDFESIEAAADGCGLWKETGYGGDVVRIRLRNFREKALTLDPEPVTETNAKNRKILITGNTGGRGVITELEGIITGIADDHIIKHNAATEGGNSGSPIVDLATHKVVGILTWGLLIPNALQAIWAKKPAEVREGINTGAGLATIRFTPTSFKHLQNQRIVMNQMKKNIRLLGLLDTLIPTKQGLFVNKNVRVMGGEFTINDLLLDSPDHPVVVELVRLDRLLSSKATGSITISNQDMLKMYVESY